MLVLAQPLVLASASPRRRELLTAAGIPHTVRPASIPEIRAPHEDPLAYVQRLAHEKALAVPAAPGDLIVAADTTVIVDGHVLEKPTDAADARRMLSLLAARPHTVATGLCLRHGPYLALSVEQTRVHFSPIDPAEIDAYVATGEPMDKAGAYAIQGQASRWVERIEGCYFNVVGLPVARLWRELKICLASA